MGCLKCLPLRSHSAMSTALIAQTVTEDRPKYIVRRYIFCQSRSVSSGFSPIKISRRPQAMLWLNGASIMALMTSGDASASPMPSNPSSVRTRTSATSWQLAVFCWTDSTRRIWQMTWSIFMGISVYAVAADEAESATEVSASLPRRLRSKGLPQHFDTLRHGDVRIFFPLKLQRHVTAVIHAGQDFGNTCVIQVERVPFAAAVIGLGLN